MRTSCGPRSRRSIVVRTSGSVAEGAAMALTVKMMSSGDVMLTCPHSPQPWRRCESLSRRVLLVPSGAPGVAPADQATSLLRALSWQHRLAGSATGDKRPGLGCCTRTPHFWLRWRTRARASPPRPGRGCPQPGSTRHPPVTGAASTRRPGWARRLPWRARSAGLWPADRHRDCGDSSRIRHGDTHTRCTVARNSSRTCEHRCTLRDCGRWVVGGACPGVRCGVTSSAASSGPSAWSGG